MSHNFYPIEDLFILNSIKEACKKLLNYFFDLILQIKYQPSITVQVTIPNKKDVGLSLEMVK